MSFRHHQVYKRTSFKRDDTIPTERGIGKLIRILSKENDPAKFSKICIEIQELLLLPENKRYVHNACADLMVWLYEAVSFHEGWNVRMEAVKCLARVGYALEEEFDRFSDWLVTSIEENKGNDDNKVILAKVIHELLKLEEEKSKLQNFYQEIITPLIRLIESAEKSQLLFVALQGIQQLIKFDEGLLGPYFEDLVDILLGWYTDAGSSFMQHFILLTLEQLGNLWLAYPTISMEFLGNFVADISAYARDLDEPGEGRQNGKKVVSLTSVLGSVLSLVHPSLHHFQPLHPFLVDAFSAVLDCGIRIPVNQPALASSMIQAASGTLIVLMDAGVEVSSFESIQEELFFFLEDQLALLKDVAEATVVSFLKLLTKVILSKSFSIELDFIESILDDRSKLRALRFDSSPRIRGEVILVFHALLNLTKNIIVLQEVYRYVLGEMEVALQTLTNTPCQLVDSNPFMEDTMTNEQAQAVLLFNLGALIDVAKNSKSLTSMYVLRPTIFDMLETMTRSIMKKPRRVDIIVTAVFQAMACHCKAYHQWAHTSSLLTVSPGDDVQISVTGVGQPELMTIHHYSRIITLLSELLPQNELSERTMDDLVMWSVDVVSFLHPKQPNIANALKNPKVNALVSSAFSRSYECSTARIELVCRMADYLFSSLEKHLQPDMINAAVNFCLHHLYSTEDDIRAMVQALLEKIPIGYVISKQWTPCSAYGDDDSCTFTSKNNHSVMKQHIKSGIEAAFNNNTFFVVMEYLLNGTTPQEKDWLRRLFTSCGHVDDSAKVISAFNSHKLRRPHPTVLWFWASWEAAMYLVQLKLRTQFGKPREMLLAVEVSLKTLSKDPKKLVKGEHHERACALLRFLDNLEKIMYNAYERTAMAMPPMPKAVQIFFSTNKDVCQEWLARIRSSAMMVSYYSNMPALVVYHGCSLLANMTTRNKVEDLENTILWVALAMVTLRSPESIRGLSIWCENTHSVKFDWLKALENKASGRFEQAADGILEIMKLEHECKDENIEEDKNDHCVCEKPLVCNKLMDALMDTYVNLGSWGDVDLWNEMKGRISEHHGEALRSFYSNDSKQLLHIKMLSSFESNNLEELVKLSDASSQKYVESSLSTFQCLTNAELEITALSKENRKNMLEIVENVELKMKKFLSSEIEDDNAAIFEKVLLLQQLRRCGDGQKAEGFSESFVASLIDQRDHIPLPLFAQAFRWSSNLLSLFGEDEAQILKLTTARAARRKDNFRLSEQILLGKNIKDACENEGYQETLLGSTSHIALEYGKLLHGKGKYSEAINTICLNFERCDEELRIRSLLTLSKWLDMESQSCQALFKNSESNLLRCLSDESKDKEQCSSSVKETLLWHAVNMSKSPKAWSAFADWCYESGKKSIEAARDGTLTLPESSLTQIKSCLLDESPEEHCEILRKTIVKAAVESRETKSELESVVDAISKQLTTFSIKVSSMEPLLQVWNEVTVRIYKHYYLAAPAYFQYLELHSSNSETPAVKKKLVTATLRILHLILQHPIRLQRELETGLSQTPARTWMGIIPQLFACLHHPQEYVRRCITKLLCKIAGEAPHLIVFPAVVGASSAQKTVGLEILENKPEDSERSSPDSTDNFDDEVLQNEEDNFTRKGHNLLLVKRHFSEIVNTLLKQDPTIVSQVQNLVKELRRICLLWDEAWLWLLSNRSATMKRRIRELATGFKKTAESATISEEDKEHLLKEKRRINLAPILWTLEELNDITSATPETSHEKQFQKKYASQISEIISRLKESNESASLLSVWNSISLLQQSLKATCHKRSLLNINEISASLANLKNTSIAMPGQAGPIVTIEGVHDMSVILPTNTRPKKLLLRGSDGKMYPYLLKGLEDLHLDERIMQFFSCVNSLLVKCESYKNNNGFRSSHYSVTPVGPRGGLIQWIEGASPLFGLYRRWLLKQEKESSGGASNKPASVTELYNKTLIRCLPENTKLPSDRKDVPLNISRKVLKELITETPNDLLAKELWCSSVSPENWWKMQQTYSHSTAAMSVSGYVIGLGDRHLDNILVHFETGKVIHIDYNVCFEKGKFLRIPEKVPFRMTQNLETALGFTGIEGIFRSSCEQILGVMRHDGELLLTLMEAFVYDPLVDWIPEDAGNQASFMYGNELKQLAKEKEREVLHCQLAYSMFVVRVMEMKNEWLLNKTSLLKCLKNMKKKITEWASRVTVQQQLGTTLSNIQQQMAVLHSLGSETSAESSSVTEKEIADRMQETEGKLRGASERVCAAAEDRNDAELQMRRALHAHSRLMATLKQPLTAIAGLDGDFNRVAVMYLQHYKIYSEGLRALLREITAEKISFNHVKSYRERLYTIQNVTEHVYGDVISFARNVKEKLGELDEEKDGDPQSKRPVQASEELNMESVRTAAIPQVNPHAMNVWLRMKQKLEGRDSNPIKTETVAEQVDFIIKEATDFDNLSVLYEGWTPWV